MSDLLHLVDAEMEAVIIGTILNSGESAYREVSFLALDDFAVEKHRLIWRAISQIAGDVHPTIDAVAECLSEAGKLDAVGGLSGLVDVDQRGIAGLRLAGFARSLRTKTIDRRACRLNAKLSNLIEFGLGANSAEVDGILDEFRALNHGQNADRPTITSVEELPPVGGLQEPIAYLRDPELQEKSVIGFTGESGCGKSTFVRACVRDANRQGIPCLILDRESPRPVAADCMERLGMVDSPLLRWWGGWNGDAAPGPTSRVVIDWVAGCSAAGLKPIVVIDSLIAFLGGDENDSNVMRSFMNGARHLADLGATVIVIHHSGKADSSADFRGSSDWKGSVDAAFHVTNLSPDGKLDRLNLRCYKSRYGFSGSIVYHYAGGKFIRDEHIEAPARTAADQLTALLRQNPGITLTAFEALAAKVGAPRSRTRDFILNGEKTGLVRAEKGAKRASHYSLIEGQKDGQF